MPIASARNCIKPQKENTASQNKKKKISPKQKNFKTKNPLQHPINLKMYQKQDIKRQNLNTRSHTKMELTRSEKLQNLKTYMKRLTKTLSIFNIPQLQEEFRKQLHHLFTQTKTMRPTTSTHSTEDPTNHLRTGKRIWTKTPTFFYTLQKCSTPCHGQNDENSKSPCNSRKIKRRDQSPTALQSFNTQFSSQCQDNWTHTFKWPTT